MTTIQLKVHNQSALNLLHELETMDAVRILKEEEPTKLGIKLSDKYRGVFSKEDAESFRKHVRKMRAEWG